MSCFIVKAKPEGIEPVFSKYHWLLREAIHVGELPSEGIPQQGEESLN